MHYEAHNVTIVWIRNRQDIPNPFHNKIHTITPEYLQYENKKVNDLRKKYS